MQQRFLQQGIADPCQRREEYAGYTDQQPRLSGQMFQFLVKKHQHPNYNAAKEHHLQGGESLVVKDNATNCHHDRRYLE